MKKIIQINSYQILLRNFFLFLLPFFGLVLIDVIVLEV